MTKHYRDYVWKEGIPYGIDPQKEDCAISYKIAMDPYRKRIAIEKYAHGQFVQQIYDSALLDFRHLKPAEQTAWQKVTIQESASQVSSAIRNQDDRLILIETYHFEKGLCRESLSHSAHGVLVAHQKMYYTHLNDHFNGVILYDSNSHPVVLKLYEVDEQNQEFTTLIKEEWGINYRI